MKARLFFLCAVGFAALAACGGGGGGSPVPIASSPTHATPTPSPTSASSTFTVQANPTSVPLPSIGGYTGTLNMPGIAGSGSVQVDVSLQPPSGVPVLQALRSAKYRIRDGSTAASTPLLYITLIPSQTVTLQSLPGFVITLPAAPAAAANVYVGAYGLQSAAAWAPIEGPATARGLTLTAVPPQSLTFPVTIAAAQTLTFGVYSTGVSSIQFAIDAQPVVHTPSTVHLTINGEDEYGHAIIGPGAYPTINLANDDATGTIVLAASSVNAPNATVAAAYNGNWISTGNASANITASIPGTSVTGTFAISPQPILTTYPGGNTNDSCCLGLTAGPDGGVWYTNGYNSIGRIAANGAVSTFAAPSTRIPDVIITGPDGALWFSDGSAGATDIGRLTTSGAYSTCTGSDFVQGAVLAAGPDGNLWVSGQNGTIVRVVPGTCAQTVFGASPPVPNANSLALGSDGAIWFAQGTPGLGVQGYVGRITTSGVVTLYPTPPTSIPIDITAGPDGNLWYIEWMTGHIGRVTTSGTITEFPGNGAHAQSAITSGPDGAMWFATSSGVGRISTAGQMTDYPFSIHPYGLVLGSDNALWGQTFFAGQMMRISI